MSCHQCQGVEEEFNSTVARRQLKRYRKRGPKGTTRWLIDAIRAHDLAGSSLLDIGGGIGEIQHELAAAGASRITGVDASSAYLERAKEEAERRGYQDRTRYEFGDFVDIASQVEPADVVTLDRVICCFHDVDSLVDRSLEKARRFYGLVFPRVTWWTKVAFRLLNLVQTIRRAKFRAYLHPSDYVFGLVSRSGFRQSFYRTSLVWQVVLFEKKHPGRSVGSG